MARRGDVRRAVRRLLDLRPQRPLAAEVLRRCRPARPVRQRQQLGDRRPTTTRPRCGCPAPPGSATWARSASCSTTGTRTTTRGRSSRRSTSCRAPATSAAATSGSGSGSTGGPQLVVTNLAVLDFEPESKRMRLKSVHPGVTVDEVQEATGFELLLPDGEVPTTADADGRSRSRLIREEIDPDEHAQARVRPRGRSPWTSSSAFPVRSCRRPIEAIENVKRNEAAGLRLGVVAVATSWAGTRRRGVDRGPHAARQRSRPTRTSTSTRW